MNFFEKNLLPSSWLRAAEGSINPILNEEVGFYHKYAKKPDTGENFRRFYAHIEPLHSFIAQKAAVDLSRDEADCSNEFRRRIEIFSETLNLHQFFVKCHKIVVLKGGIDLAHGDVLKKQIKNLSKQEVCCIGLILIDYSSVNIPTNLLALGVEILALGSIPNLKDRYAVVSYGLANFTKESDVDKEIIWWGIAFGMIFTYQLAINLAAQSGSRMHCKRSYLTVKHHHSFSHNYVDRVYTSTPCVSGFTEIHKPEISTFTPSFYDKSMLLSDSSFLSREDNLVLDNLKKIKNNGARLFSSVSRVEKTCDFEYMNVIEGILGNIDDSVLVCFGKIFPPRYQLLVTRFGKNRIFFAGWRSPPATVAIIGMLDLFLDPFPFGAGMTFASAGYQRIPIISTSDFVNSSPSSISILYHFYKDQEFSFDKIVAESLFGSAASMLDRSTSVLKNKDHFVSCSAKMKVVIENIFINPRTSILCKKTL